MMSENMPIISVIVPSYNHGKYIQETIESIVNQTYRNIELIVIDDGSTDNSVQIISKLSSQYNFIFVHRPNKGLSATLNEGIRSSKGKFISICASDDIYKLDKIEKQVLFMKSNPEFGMCYGKTINFDDFGNEKKNNPKHAKSGWIFKELIFQKFTIPAATCLIKTDLFKVIGYFDENLLVEDWDMYLRIADKYQVGFLNEYLAYYRQHDTNISKQKTKTHVAQKTTLEKWKDSIHYNQAMILWKLKWCNIFASYNKIEGCKCYLKNIKYFYYRSYIKGIIGLIFKGWR